LIGSLFECRYTKAVFHKLQVATMLLGSRLTSANQLCVQNDVTTLNAVIRNAVYKFMMRLMDSQNEIIIVFIWPDQVQFAALEKLFMDYPLLSVCPFLWTLF